MATHSFTEVTEKAGKMSTFLPTHYGNYNNFFFVKPSLILDLTSLTTTVSNV